MAGDSAAIAENKSGTTPIAVLYLQNLTSTQQKCPNQPLQCPNDVNSAKEGYEKEGAKLKGNNTSQKAKAKIAGLLATHDKAAAASSWPSAYVEQFGVTCTGGTVQLQKSSSGGIMSIYCPLGRTSSPRLYVRNITSDETKELTPPNGVMFRPVLSTGQPGQKVMFGAGYMVAQVCKSALSALRLCIDFGVVAIKEALLFDTKMTPDKLRDIKSWKYITGGNIPNLVL